MTLQGAAEVNFGDFGARDQNDYSREQSVLEDISRQEVSIVYANENSEFIENNE